MSYASAAALQEAVYQRLFADTALTASVGTAIYDAAPSGIAPKTYVSLGPEDAKDASDAGNSGAWHDFTVSVVTEEAGFHTAKDVAALISDALVDADLTLSRGRLLSLRFLSARARRVEDGDIRRIDLKFRARVDED
ncbi:MAG: DUF3168 domain-containing protein [Pseudomonadota bacterium]